MLCVCRTSQRTAFWVEVHLLMSCSTPTLVSFTWSKNWIRQQLYCLWVGPVCCSCKMELFVVCICMQTVCVCVYACCSFSCLGRLVENCFCFSLCVCVHVCLCACAFVCMCVCMCVCIVYMCVSVHVSFGKGGGVTTWKFACHFVWKDWGAAGVLGWDVYTVSPNQQLNCTNLLFFINLSAPTAERASHWSAGAGPDGRLHCQFQHQHQPHLPSLPQCSVQCRHLRWNRGCWDRCVQPGHCQGRRFAGDYCGTGPWSVLFICMLYCAATASTYSLLSTWLNSWWCCIVRLHSVTASWFFFTSVLRL